MTGQHWAQRHRRSRGLSSTGLGSRGKWHELRYSPNSCSYRVHSHFPRKERSIILVLAVLVISLTVLTLSFVTSPWALPVLAGNQREPDYKEIIIEPGDTLWKLAGTYGRPDLDPRRIIWEIQQFNHLHDGTLQVGQLLRLPRKILR